MRPRSALFAPASKGRPFSLFRLSYHSRLGHAIPFKTLTMDFAPVERLWRLLLPFQTAQQNFLLIGATKTVLAQPHFPSRASFAVRPNNKAANEPWFASETYLGDSFLVRLAGLLLDLPSHNPSLFRN